MMDINEFKKIAILDDGWVRWSGIHEINKTIEDEELALGKIVRMWNVDDGWAEGESLMKGLEFWWGDLEPDFKDEIKVKEWDCKVEIKVVGSDIWFKCTNEVGAITFSYVEVE